MSDQPWTMAGPLSVPFDEHPCLCRSEHAPPVPWTHRHHIHPLYAGGPDIETNIVHVCPATHDWIHVIIRDFEREGFRKSRKVEWPHYAFMVAKIGYQKMYPDDPASYQ